jgi:hypothetical protein
MVKALGCGQGNEGSKLFWTCVYDIIMMKPTCQTPKKINNMMFFWIHP